MYIKLFDIGKKMNKSKQKTQDISFCGKRALNIIPSEIKQEVMDSIQSYGIKINQRYANLLQFQSLNHLAKQPHLISIKTAGTNYFLYLTQLNGVPSCLFIDRKIKSGYSLPRVLLVHMKFSDELFEDTLLDGELVKDADHNWMFLLHDLLVYKGKKIEKDVITKYNTMYSMLKNEFQPDPLMDNCPLFVKKLFTYTDAQKMITQFIPRLTYPIRGLYFNTLFPKHHNYLFLYPSKDTMHGGISKEKVVKQKEEPKQEKMENVFLVSKTDTSDVYQLSKDGESMGEAHIPNLKTSKQVRRALEDKEEVYFQCIKNENFNKWELKQLVEV